MRYRSQVRPLWPIELQVLAIAAAEYPDSALAIRRQMESAQVVSFQNTGAGFFSNLVVATEVPLLADKSPLSALHKDVYGVEHGMGFIVFLEEGHLSMIEGYSFGDVSTADVDFSRATFELTPRA